MMRIRTVTLCLSLATTGCFGNFDAHLYQARESDSGTMADAGIPTLALGDFCMNGTSVPSIPRPASATEAESTAYNVDTSGLTDDVREVAACTGAREQGNDGFASIMMLANERWHFHLRRPSGGANASLYILMSDCDERACSGGQDLCGDSSDEHFTFVAPSDGLYYLGVDSDAPGGFSGELDVIHPVCGDHTREHSEGCDDGNTTPGDGCDAICRAELTTGMAEVEANDDTFSANHVIIGTTSATTSVLGHIASACESDVFAIDVPAGETASITASVALTAGGCPADATIPISLAVLALDGSTALATTTLASSGGCPMVGGAGSPLAALTPGLYYVRIRSIGNTAPDRPLDYTLSIAATFTP